MSIPLSLPASPFTVSQSHANRCWMDPAQQAIPRQLLRDGGKFNQILSQISPRPNFDNFICFGQPEKHFSLNFDKAGIRKQGLPLLSEMQVTGKTLSLLKVKCPSHHSHMAQLTGSEPRRAEELHM